MSAGSPAQHTKAARLARVARKLHPTRPPFYVQHGGMDPTTPLVGWYWQPSGCPFPVPLGASYDQSLMALTRLVDLQSATPQAA